MTDSSTSTASGTRPDASKYNWEAIPKLLGLLVDGADEEKWMAAHALGVIQSKKATRALIRILRAESEKARQSAAYALGWLGDRRAARALVQVVESPASSPDLVSFAVEALTTCGLGWRQAQRAVINALMRPDTEIRIAAVCCVHNWRLARAVPVLQRLTTDESGNGLTTVSREAIEAIEHIQGHV